MGMPGSETGKNSVKKTGFDGAVITRNMLNAGLEQCLIRGQIQGLSAFFRVYDPIFSSAIKRGLYVMAGAVKSRRSSTFTSDMFTP